MAASKRSTSQCYPTLITCGVVLLLGVLASCSDPDNATPPPVAQTNTLSARIETDRGTIVVDLATDRAPVLSANFANLVGRQFFDGLAFYRSSTVMRQAGNPYHTEGQYYNPGYRLLPEFNPELTFDTGGVLAMLLWRDDNLADLRQTEFFLTVKPQDPWTFKYPIFGFVREGGDVVLALQDGDVIRSVRLEGDPTALFTAHANQRKQWNEALDASPPRSSSN